MPSQEEIYSKVSATLVEALNVDDDEISPKVALQGGLGAEIYSMVSAALREALNVDDDEISPKVALQGGLGAEIYSKVSATLVEALNVDDDEISPKATLQGDLGAESIDFLDIVFRLEREFNIKIPRGELFPESIFQGDPDFVQNGRLTDKGLVELRARMPYADLTKFEQNPEVASMGDLFTVELITKYIQ